MTYRSLWIGPAPLILASASAIRCEILENAGIPVEVRPANIEERTIEAASNGLAPERLAATLASAKALTVSGVSPSRLVLGCDQVLALGAEVLHKPKDRDEAARHLARLSGKTHNLHSALALARDGAIIWQGVESAALTMRTLNVAFIERYLDAAGEAVLASVGAYQLEALGAHLFDLIEGDHTTILGLPLLPLLRALRQSGECAA